MEKHYTKNMGEITYVYGVNLEEHKTMIEKQQKRIAELEQKCLLYEKEMLNCSQLENGMSLCIVQKQRIAELEQELAKYKDLQDQLGLENVDELEWFVMLDLLTDNEKNMHILDLHRKLAELKEKAIVPRFKRQEIVYCFSYGKIQLFNVVAYLDNQITLCENRETGKLEFVNNDYLCINEQEAQAKLKEIQGNE